MVLKKYLCPYCNALSLTSDYCEFCLKRLPQHSNQDDGVSDNLLSSYASFFAELTNDDNLNTIQENDPFQFIRNLEIKRKTGKEIIPEQRKKFESVFHKGWKPGKCWYCKKNHWNKEFSHRVFIHKVLNVRWYSLKSIEKTYTYGYCTIPCCSECGKLNKNKERIVQKIQTYITLGMFILGICGILSSYLFSFPCVFDVDLLLSCILCPLVFSLVLRWIMDTVISYKEDRNNADYPVLWVLKEEGRKKGKSPNSFL